MESLMVCADGDDGRVKVMHADGVQGGLVGRVGLDGLRDIGRDLLDERVVPVGGHHLVAQLRQAFRQAAAKAAQAQDKKLLFGVFHGFLLRCVNR